MNDVNDLNILVGGNDAGKSNILKALNLFFNNETELDTYFDFNDDLSRLREEQARQAKGRMQLWIKITFNNFNKWKSLPKQFAVKKAWNRYTDIPENTYFPNDISSTSVTKYLNKITFHYIPAIRGRDIFSYYLSLLHDSLAENEKAGIKNATESLIRNINDNTLEMSDQIKSGLGFESSIKVPNDLRDLFAALDFSTTYSNFEVPLQKRGDGIQARHIPFILDFIAQLSNRHHIWAYEEPETSLELGKAFELANQFNTDFSELNQIFITTHSPAFYDLENKRVSKWQVSQKQFENTNNLITTCKYLTEQKEPDLSLGVTALITKRARQLYDEIDELKNINVSLVKTINESQQPQVIVEGITDQIILQTAFNKLYPSSNINFNLINANGCKNITKYLTAVKTFDNSINTTVVGLYDNDQAGFCEFSSLCKNIPQLSNNLIELSKSKLFCCMLPIPLEIQSLIDNTNELQDHIVPIEFMFPKDIIKLAIANKIIKLNDQTGHFKNNNICVPHNLTLIFQSILSSDDLYLIKTVDESCKMAFANWTKNLTADSFRNFIPLFETINQIMISTD